MITFYLYMSMKDHHLSLHIICEIVTTMNPVRGWYKGFRLNFLSQRRMHYKEFHLELLIEKISFTKDYTSKKFSLWKMILGSQDQ